MENIQISRVIADDAEGIQAAVTEASKGMYGLCGWSPKEIDDHFSSEKVKEGVEKMRKAITAFTEVDVLFVAKDKSGMIVGCCFAQRQENMNKIEAVYILPKYQGHGLGKRLYDRAYELLNHNHDTILDVFSLNSKAIDFYRGLGFIETGKKSFDERFAGSGGKMLEITEMKLLGKK